LHFPSRHRDSTLWSVLPCGVRTFLPALIRPATVCARKLIRDDPTPKTLTDRNSPGERLLPRSEQVILLLVAVWG
jgi:hypothetical protein